jgi:hypothetical protein
MTCATAHAHHHDEDHDHDSDEDHNHGRGRDRDRDNDFGVQKCSRSERIGNEAGVSDIKHVKAAMVATLLPYMFPSVARLLPQVGDLVHVTYPVGLDAKVTSSTQGSVVNVEDGGSRLRVKVHGGTWEGERVFVRGQAEVDEKVFVRGQEEVDRRYKYVMLSDTDLEDRQRRADTRAAEHECQKLYGVPMHRAAVDRCFGDGTPGYGPQGRVATVRSAHMYQLKMLRRDLLLQVLSVGDTVKIGHVQGVVQEKATDSVVVRKVSGESVRVYHAVGQTLEILEKTCKISRAEGMCDNTQEDAFDMIRGSREDLRHVRSSLEVRGFIGRRRWRQEEEEDGETDVQKLMHRLFEAKKHVEEKSKHVKGS